MPITDINECLVSFKRSVESVEPAARQRILDAAESYAERARSSDIDGIDSRLAQDIRDAAEQAEKEKMIARRAAYLNFKAESSLFNFLTDPEWRDAPQEALNAFFYGSNVGRFKAQNNSIGSAQEALTKSYQDGLLARLNEKGLLHFMQGTGFGLGGAPRDKELFMALRQAHSENPDFSNMQPDAIEAAQIIYEYQELARKDANFHGAYIGKLDGYTMTRTHDMHKINNAGKDAWVEWMGTHLDLDRTFPELTPEKRIQKLEQDWDDFASGEHLKAPASRKEGQIPAGLASRAKPMSHQRTYHFKTADDEYSYHEQYGIGHVGESINEQLAFMASNTALMSKLGPNAEMNMDRAITRAKLELRKHVDTDTQTAFANRVDYMKRTVWPNITGEANIPGNHMAAMISFSVRALEALTKLGMAGISSVSDVSNMSRALKGMGIDGYMGGGFKGISELLRVGQTDPQMKSFIASLGAGFDGLGALMARRYDTYDNAPGQFTRLLNIFFKINGLTFITDRTRLAFTKAMGQALHEWRDLNLDQLNPNAQNAFRRAGITSERWDVIRGNTAEQIGDFSFLIPEKLMDLDDATVTGLLNTEGRPVTRRSINEMRRELRDQFRSFYHNRAMSATIVPNVHTRATMNQGQRPGTFLGVLMRAVMQFKGFPIAVGRQAFGEEAYSRTRDVGWRAPFNRSAMLGMTQFIVATGLFGYVAMSAKDILKNRTPRTPDDMGDLFSIASASILQGGGLGIYGDFLFGEMKNRYGGGPLETFLGPTWGTASRIAAIWGDLKSGDPNASRAVNTALQLMPGSNLVGLRQALDYAILYDLQEQLSPGYMDRMERRMERENDQQFLISPR